MQSPTSLAPLLAAGLCLVAVYVPRASTQEPTESLASRAELLATGAMREQAASGLSIFAERGGQPELAQGFGFEVWDPEQRAGPDSLHRVGPLLGHFLNVAVLRLVQEGELELTDALEALLPDLREEPWEGVELRHLLAQTSGVPSFAPLLANGRFESFPQADVIAWLGTQSLNHEPGFCFEASPSNALLLGLILEAKTGRAPQDWIDARLFGPAGLEATGWRWTGGGPHITSAQRLPFGADGLHLSAPALARWLRALVEADILDSQRFELLLQPVRLNDGTLSPHGMGLRATTFDGERRYTLVSSFAGSHARVAHYPDRDFTLAILAAGTEIDLMPIEQALARTALGLPEPGIQDLPLSSEQQELYLGGYYVGCNRLGIVRAGARLRLESADGITILLLYQGEQYFISANDPGLRLTFAIEEGKATSFLLEDHGTQTVAQRID